MKYVEIDTLLSKIYRDFGEEINTYDSIEWAAEALEFIGANPYYVETVAFMKVENHQVEVPKGFHAIIQLARNNRWSSETNSELDILKNKICPSSVVTKKASRCPVCIENCEDITTIAEQDCPHTDCYKIEGVPIDCDGKPIMDYEEAHYRPYFDVRWESHLWGGSQLYKQQFTPIRLSDNSFFNSIVCKENDFDNLYSTCRDEYTIIAGSILRFSFKEGQIAISYLKQPLDSKGFPLIPDDIICTTAIIKYIILKMLERKAYSDTLNNKGLLVKAEQDWQWYCSQAKNDAKMPQTIDDFENLKDQLNYRLPNKNHYSGFFGKLSYPENKRNF
jgi:hypothetical protein